MEVPVDNYAQIYILVTMHNRKKEILKKNKMERRNRIAAIL